jgi:DNA-binding protein YbaB
MPNPLDALGGMKKLQELQATLQKEELTFERNGVKVTVRGDQQITHIEIDGIVEKRVIDVINEAQQKLQQSIAPKLFSLYQQG